MIPVLGSPTPPASPRDCAHFLHKRAPNTVICHEDRVPKTPDPCDSANFPGRLTREAAKAAQLSPGSRPKDARSL